MGSLIAAWLGQLSAAPLVLLGRSGRMGRDSALTPHSFGTALVTLARCDVASAEETDFLLSTTAASRCEPLQVPFIVAIRQHCCCSSCLRCEICTSLNNLIVYVACMPLQSLCNLCEHPSSCVLALIFWDNHKPCRASCTRERCWTAA